MLWDFHPLIEFPEDPDRAPRPEDEAERRADFRLGLAILLVGSLAVGAVAVLGLAA